MKDIVNELDKLLFDNDNGLLNNNGLLIKYHFNQGLDYKQLDKLYEVLEIIKKEWKYQKLIPKEIVFKLIDIVPALYMDLPLYKDNPKYYEYEEILYNLSTAMAMVVNPNIDDIHFNKPLKDLGI